VGKRNERSVKDDAMPYQKKERKAAVEGGIDTIFKPLAPSAE
jgi:hypothetical protein